ncbi:ceramidase [Rhodobiaceae bacterium]|nr:ceramidase [Rhodobiaceae bacterium]
MNFFKKTNSFFIALSASIMFFLIYFILAKAGLIVTLEPNLSVGDISRWCERVSPSIFREPINAFSNVGFMITGLIMFWILSKEDNKTNDFTGLTNISILYASVVIFLGPGSFLMHGTHSYWGQWIDNVSMVTYIIVPWLYNLKELGNWSFKRFFTTYTLIVFIFSLLSWFFGTNMGINLDLFGVSIALWIISEFLYKFWGKINKWYSGFIGFLVASIFGIFPNEIFSDLGNYWWIVLFWLPALLSNSAPTKTRVYSPWFFLGMISYVVAFIIWLQGYPDTKFCNPDSFIQPHGIWHLLTAFATWCFFKFYRTERLI